MKEGQAFTGTNVAELNLWPLNLDPMVKALNEIATEFWMKRVKEAIRLAKEGEGDPTHPGWSNEKIIEKIKAMP